jgi:hypothetical protein
MISEIPDWAQNLTAEPEPQESHDSKSHANPQSEAERIVAARARGMADSRNRNTPGAQYGWDFHESYYADFSGPETSEWNAAVLVCIANILETPILKRSKYVWQRDNYDPQTGTFTLSDAPAVSIQELKDALDARIAELDLSKVKIWEWFADVREPIGHEWWRADLQIRIQKFKAA